MGFIYKITNLINNKVYIGLTTETIEKRWKSHISCVGKVKRHLYYAMVSYKPLMARVKIPNQGFRPIFLIF